LVYGNIPLGHGFGLIGHDAGQVGVHRFMPTLNSRMIELRKYGEVVTNAGKRLQQLRKLVVATGFAWKEIAWVEAVIEADADHAHGGLASRASDSLQWTREIQRFQKG